MVDDEDEAVELLVEDALALVFADEVEAAFEAEEILDFPASEIELRLGEDTGIFDAEDTLDGDGVGEADASLDFAELEGEAWSCSPAEIEAEIPKETSMPRSLFSAAGFRVSVLF